MSLESEFYNFVIRFLNLQKNCKYEPFEPCEERPKKYENIYRNELIEMRKQIPYWKSNIQNFNEIYLKAKQDFDNNYNYQLINYLKYSNNIYVS